MTRKYASWGSKLLNHADVLQSIQSNRIFKPITVQLAPTENCESHCPFCSVDNRPLKSVMPWGMLDKCLRDFASLQAKSVEITGGGNPMLYRHSGRTVNDIVALASSLGMDVGIITNSHDISRLNDESRQSLKWLRISLIKLDEGKEPEDYNLSGFPVSKLGFSYIIHEGTTPCSIMRMERLVELHPDVKFVRLAGNCLIKKNNIAVRDKYGQVIEAIDNAKFFFKDIQGDDDPFDDGCYTGLVRPYIASHPDGNGEYHVYICTSHVLNRRNYDLDYSLGIVENVIDIWGRLNAKFSETGHPYEVKGNGGKDWCNTCKFCYYKHNNQLLHTVANELPDKNFA